ncbi:MAG: glycosyltransferase [Candidatus Didemnitutus sp.]|nr:glycosyltransferase [Candidatus Didemnitutus sp.]
MPLCHVVPSLEDRHGGPSKSVRALANAMAARTPTALLTTLEPGQSMLPAGPQDAAPVTVFPREAPRWLCRSAGLAAHLRATRYDVVHSHALWLLTLRYAHDAALRHGAPLVISPRGMLTEWAWQHRRWRKRIADWLVHPGALRAAAGWHATSADEANDIRRRGFTQPICVAPNGVEIPAPAELAAARAAWRNEFPVLRERRVAVFYSRFHRKKRLRELVELWLARAPADWLLLVAGVPEEYSVAEVAQWAEPGRVLVVDGRERPAPFAAAELFLLPSHSENFGLVVAEALAAGVPALVTDTTPWQGLDRHDAGACVAWERFDATLARALAAAPETLAAQGARGRAWVADEFTWASAAGTLLDFYASLPR